jgi:transcriptional regulator MraZ
MLLTGKFLRTLDEKHRLAIPKSLRESLGDQAGLQLFVAPATDGALAVYPEATFAQLVERLAVGSPTARDVRDYRRLFFSQAASTKLDRQGRLRIPLALVQWAKLNGEVVLLGVQDHVELWNRGAWEQYSTERRDRYDQIAEAAFGDTKT